MSWQGPQTRLNFFLDCIKYLCFVSRKDYCLCSGEINHDHVHCAGFGGGCEVVLSLSDLHA